VLVGEMLVRVLVSVLVSDLLVRVLVGEQLVMVVVGELGKKITIAFFFTIIFTIVLKTPSSFDLMRAPEPHVHCFFMIICRYYMQLAMPPVVAPWRTTLRLQQQSHDVLLNMYGYHVVVVLIDHCDHSGLRARYRV
jgi:hypothetical protein